MVCYAVPLIATLVIAIRRRVLGEKDAEGFWLNLMLAGGAIFGVVDHFWNGELFLLGSNWIADISLGTVITLGIFTSWGLIIFGRKIAYSSRPLSRKTGIYK